MDDLERTADDGSMATLRVVWLETHAASPAFPLEHPYVELVYTPLVGAVAVLFLRRIALLGGEVDAVDLDAVVTASELGLRASNDGGLGRNSPFVKMLHRLERCGLARWLDAQELGVFRQAPALADRLVAGLPESARSIHRRYLQQADPGGG